MILGMSLSAFTTFHVVLSLIGILSGFVVVFELFNSAKPGGWTALFLASTVLTSATGYLFPASGVSPAHIVGAISLVSLAAAIYALYARHLTGSWRLIYVVGAVLALYLNAFVGGVQAFQKLPFLMPLAPTQSEPPFLIAQVAVLAIFIAVGVVAGKKYRPEV
jgi:hypothetical protein